MRSFMKMESSRKFPNLQYVSSKYATNILIFFQSIFFQFDRAFNIETDTSCSYDYVKIFSVSKTNVKGKY